MSGLLRSMMWTWETTACDRNRAVTFSRLPGVGRHSWLSAPGHRPPIDANELETRVIIPAAPGLEPSPPRRHRRRVVALPPTSPASTRATIDSVLGNARDG